MHTPNFGTAAPILAQIGYDPLPLEPEQKRPVDKGWPDGHPVQHYLPHRAHFGVGLLGRRTPAVDLDLTTPELVELLVDYAGDLIGAGPIRYGNRPKALLLYSAEESIPYMRTRDFAAPGERWTDPKFKPSHRVEILGDRRQSAAYAIHPRTGRPYEWPLGGPLEIHAVDLPLLDQALATRFIKDAEAAMLAAGFVPLRRENGRWCDDRRPRPKPRPSPARPRDPDSRHARWWCASPEDAARRVDSETAHKVGRSWRCRCPVHNGEHTDSLSFIQGRDGRLVFRCHFECSQDELIKAIREALA